MNVPATPAFPARDALLRAVTVAGLATVALTEWLSAFDAIRAVPLAIGWVLVGIGSALTLIRRPLQLTRIARSRDPVIWLCAAGTALVLSLTAMTAVCSPPNSADA